MQISLLGRLQNKSLDHYDCLFVASISQQSGNSLRAISLVHKITFKQIVGALFQSPWNFLNIILWTWDKFLHTSVTELHILFMTRSKTFFSSTVFATSWLVFLLIRRQSSERLPPLQKDNFSKSVIWGTG